MPDGNDYRLINELARHTGWAHAPATAYATYGVGLFALLALIMYARAWWQRHQQTAVGAGWAGIAGLIGLAVNQLFVHALNEPRPYAVMPHALVLIPRSTDPSAPSDHAVVVAAVATGLLLVNRRIGLLTWVLALLMAFTRVYVGAHYPSDVLLGLAEGTLVAILGGYLARPVLTQAWTGISRTRLAVLVVRPPKPIGQLHR
jgi:membrane-associated phospholipid phosphatase